MPEQKPWVRLSVSGSPDAESQRLLQIFSTQPETANRIPTEATANFNEAFEVAIPIGNIEIPDLSDFPTARQKADLLRVRAARGGVGTEFRESLGTPALEGLFPSFSDHKIDNYLQKMRPLAGL